MCAVLEPGWELKWKSGEKERKRHRGDIEGRWREKVRVEYKEGMYVCVCERECVWVHARCVSDVPKVLLAVFSYWLVCIDLPWHTHTLTHMHAGKQNPKTHAHTHAHTQHGSLYLVGLWHMGHERTLLTHTHACTRMHAPAHTGLQSFWPITMTTIPSYTQIHTHTQTHAHTDTRTHRPTASWRTSRNNENVSRKLNVLYKPHISAVIFLHLSQVQVL